jgi:hypothetical protein
MTKQEALSLMELKTSLTVRTLADNAILRYSVC